MSAERDEWVKMCRKVREGLARQVELIDAMNPGEITSLAAAIDAAMWNECKALAHDEAIEERRSSLERLTAYGG